ncbi:MAG TPA: TIM barrel protein [Anaerolineales bacterium]|nr:TIM barrel protein [Anaerolineales bacterium]
MIKIANAPCSWGVLEFDLEGEAAGYAQVLDEMKAAGYDGTELGDWGFMPTDPILLRDELRARDLVMLGAFVPVDFSNPDVHAAGAETAVRIAELLAPVGKAPVIVLADENGKNLIRTQNAGRIRPEQSLSDDQWEVFAAGVEHVARAVQDATGVRCVFHHHCAGFVETPEEIERLLGLTNPELVGLCFDTGHYGFGGGDAVEGVRKHASRIWHFHFKDHDPEIAARARENDWDYFTSVRNGIFCELGKGNVDFAAVIQELQQAGYDGWGVVEQDVLPGMGSPKESAARNRAYLRGLGL